MLKLKIYSVKIDLCFQVKKWIFDWKIQTFWINERLVKWVERSSWQRSRRKRIIPNKFSPAWEKVWRFEQYLWKNKIKNYKIKESRFKDSDMKACKNCQKEFLNSKTSTDLVKRIQVNMEEKCDDFWKTKQRSSRMQITITRK